jgi:hypothetical protein
MKDQGPAPTLEYRVEDPVAPWQKFQAVARKALTEQKLTKPASQAECQPVPKNDHNPK